jgi:carboxymethylenebutenolidase
MIENERTLATPDGPMRVFSVRPDEEGPFPVALLYMDAVGYREQLKENARRFASAGFYCFAPDLFHHFGENVTHDFHAIAAAGFQGPEIEAMLGMAMALKPELVEGDTEAVLEAAAADPAADDGPKVCVGYCMGARHALHAASAMPEEFVAAAGIHPGPLAFDSPDSPHHDLDTVTGELYFAFADRDDHAPPESRDRLRAEMAERGIPGTVETMPGTYHGFAMADIPPYKEEAAEAHFERTIDLWRRNVQKQPAGV